MQLVHMQLCFHPKKRQSLKKKKNEQEACIWLDEGGLLTSDDIQEKIKARELKRAKANKQAAEQKKLQAKLVREQKQAEAQAKRDAKAEQKLQRLRQRLLVKRINTIRMLLLNQNLLSLRLGTE